jgi:uncharacterized membrane protein
MNTKKKTTKTAATQNKTAFLFERTNFYIMIAGLVLITIGFFLMIGGGSDDPAEFNEAIFNARRLTVSPIILLIGYGLQIVAIFYKKKEKIEEQ